MSQAATQNSNSSLVIDVVIQRGAWPAEMAMEAFAARIAEAICCRVEMPARAVEAVVSLSDDDAVRTLNAQYRDQEKSTNVLSFPAVVGVSGNLNENQAFMLGHIILALETVSSEASGQGIEIEHHIAHLIVHGILHLLGYDHETIDEAETMEALEVKILAALDIDNPYTEELVGTG